MNLDIDLLMELQYSLPLSTTPLADLAENLGRSYDEVEKTLRLYVQKGIIKRYGVNLNYRAFSGIKQAALVGFKAHDVEKVARRINEFDEITVKHNFLRDAEYDVWFTIKARSVEEIEKTVARIAYEVGVTDYVILPTKRVYKMDVKYDLRRGISWSTRGMEPESVAMISELGLDESFVRSLESLEVVRRPFARYANLGYGEEEVVSIIEELLDRNVGRDFSGVLRESKIGFKENGMTVLRIRGEAEKIAKELIEKFPQITHLIERVACENWNYPLYFMVHATNREPIEKIRDEVLKIEGVEEARVVYSTRNLRES